MEDQDFINEFLIESNENLARLDQEMVELEQRPKDAQLLSSIFRTIHTIKGTCGFLGFTILEGITHIAESILSQVRNNERDLTPALVSIVLEAVDAVKHVLTVIEATGNEGDNPYTDLKVRLQHACDNKDGVTAAKPAVAAETPASAAAPPASAPEASQPAPLAAAEIPKPEEHEPVPSPVAAVRAESVAEAAAPPAAAEGEAGTTQKSTVADSTIRVDVGLLDKLMNLVGELVLARNQILQFNAQQEDATFNATSQRLNLITSELQEGVMKTRMQPIGVVWNKLPRVVRDLASSCGKQIQLEMDGAETELDKTIIEAIKDPLTHIVRNCCDHGIERPEIRAAKGKAPQGRLMLRAFHEGGHVNIEIIDDGAGIDPKKVKNKAVQKGLLLPEQAERMGEREAISLIFLPGFSTAEKVTNISGRGVGMDVVKTNIEKIGGVVDLMSRAGEGTTVKIKIPLTLAIIPGLVITSGGERFVIPQVSLLELVRLEGESGNRLIEWIHGTPVYRQRGRLLPLAYLNEVLGTQPPGSNRNSEVLNIVVLQAEERHFGLVVDGISDTQEIVVKPLGKQLKGVSCYAGATIMGDGKVALILDVMGIATRSGVVSESRDSGRTDEPQRDRTQGEKQSLLLFSAGSFERLAVPLSLVARLEEIPRAKIEFAAGRRVVQYRGRLLPLVSLSEQLEHSRGGKDTTQDPAQVIVFSDGERQLGILVDQILDIVEEVILVKQKATHAGLLGSAVIGQKVTDFVDLHSVIENAGGEWFRQRPTQERPAAVLIADASSFSRGLLRNYLEMAGHLVIEASSAHEAFEKLLREKVRVVVAACGGASSLGIELRDKMKRQSELARIPLVAVAEQSDHARLRSSGDFDELLLKFDREAMLESVERLAAAVGGAVDSEKVLA